MGCVYLGLDVGTTSTKCLAVDDEGRALALTQHAYSLNYPSEGWAEQDAEDYWRAVVSAVRRCMLILAEKGFRASDVSAISMSTQGDTLVLTDSAGRPVFPALSWMDTRASAQYRRLEETPGPALWYVESGQPLIPHSSACKLLWLREEHPEEWSRVAHIGHVPDFLAHRLCGTFAVDVPSASWCSVYSAVRRDWSQTLLDAVGLDRAMLAAPLESGQTIGTLTMEAARELDLRGTVRLVAGAFDQAAAAHGAQAVAGGRGVLSCGTAWVLYSASVKAPQDPSGNLCVCCHVRPDEWGLVLPFSGGSAYDWLARVAPAVHSSASDSAPLVFVPHLYGGLSPDWREASRGSLLGLSMSHTAEDIHLALMQGIAFETRRNLEAADGVGGQVSSVRMVGGAVKSSIWPQMVADALNCTVEASDFVESAAFGAARLAAGTAAADWPMPGESRDLLPRPAESQRMNERYQRYVRFYQALCGLYES